MYHQLQEIKYIDKESTNNITGDKVQITFGYLHPNVLKFGKYKEYK